MRELLFLSQRIPFPPDKGDKIRSFHILEHLSRNWRVRLGCFVDDPADWRHVPALERLCVEVRALPLDRRRASLRGMTGLLDGRPLTLPWFHDSRLARWAAETARTADAAFVYSSAMAQYVMGPARPRRLVLDLVDVDSDKWRLYAEHRRGPSRWVHARESRRLLAFERAAAAQADAVVLVSKPEADLFRKLAPEVAGKV
ncbi:MAG: hypothetical protein HQL39_12110, partial [Alphaproteobacteria bacterium]|nr:hypothetical protein [Alphaproteobacteria bacterium]